MDSTTVTATFLFTDLVDSTAIASRLQADDAEALRQAHFGILRAAAEASGGIEVKNLGDGLMLMFTSPSRALACGVAIQQGIHRHNRRSAIPLAVRVGVSMGEATEEEGDYFGDPVVEASRLCSAAEGGQVLTTELLRMVLGRRTTLDLVPVGELELKGIPDPVAACEVRWDALEAPGDVPLPARLATAASESLFGFFGRSEELAAISDTLKQAAADRRPRVVLLGGEPGIGKTTVAAHTARAAHAEGAIALFGHCTEDLGIPYQPWIEAVCHLVEHAPDDVMEEHLARYGTVLSRIVPTVSSRVSTPPIVERAAVDADTERFLLLEAAAGLLDAASSASPVIVVLDDMQWADNATLQLFRHTVTAADPGATVFVVTYRDSDISRDHPLTALLADFQRVPTARRFRLRGLDDAELLEMMEAGAGHEMTEEGVALAHALGRETEGNPFFTAELLRHLWETGAITYDADARYVLTVDLDHVGLPNSVRDVVSRRVTRLGDESVRVLSLAAVIGREFDFDVLHAVVELDEDLLLDLLDAATTSSVVAEHPDVPGAYRFEHALIQHTLYHDLSGTRRQRAHQRVAEALEAIGGERRVPAAELARHWGEAARPADAAKAVEYQRVAAGDEAIEALAPDDAVAWYERALEWSETRAPGDERAHGDLLVALGTAQRLAGMASHRETLLAAAHLAIALGATDLLIAAALANSRGSQTLAFDTERCAVVEQALAAVGDSDTAERARLLVTLANESDPKQWQRAHDLAVESIAVARRVADEATLLDVLNASYSARSFPEELDARLADTAEAIAIADLLGVPGGRFMARFNAFQAVMEHGDRARGDTLSDEMVELADTMRLPLHRWNVMMVRGALAQVDGDIARLEELNDATFSIGSSSGQPEAMGVYVGVLLEIRKFQGRLDEAIDILAPAAADNPDIDSLTAAAAAAFCDVGRHEDARAIYAHHAQQRFRDVIRGLQWLSTMHSFSRSAVALRDPTGAGVLYDLILPFERLVSVPVATCTGAMAMPLGSLATLLGRYDDAERHLSVALEIHERMRSPYYVAMTHLEQATLCRARGAEHDAEHARELATTALTTTHAKGFAGLERHAESLLAEAPGSR